MDCASHTVWPMPKARPTLVGWMRAMNFIVGGTASRMVRIRKLCRFVLQKPYRGLSAGPSEGVGPPQSPATGKMPGVAGWGLQSATPQRDALRDSMNPCELPPRLHLVVVDSGKVRQIDFPVMGSKPVHLHMRRRGSRWPNPCLLHVPGWICLPGPIVIASTSDMSSIKNPYRPSYGSSSSSWSKSESIMP